VRDRTKQGLVLEKILHNMKWRWLLCWKGTSDDKSWGGAYDCACCITYFNNEDTRNCGCPCHRRIEAMANTPEMLYFLLALEAEGEIPFVPKDYVDWMTYNRKLKREHDVWRKEGNPDAGTPEDISKCCEACKMVQDMEDRFKEHQKDPKMNCGKPCHVCDEYRAAKAKELKEIQRISKKLASKKKKNA
jgi:hypothetical protein